MLGGGKVLGGVFASIDGRVLKDWFWGLVVNNVAKDADRFGSCLVTPRRMYGQIPSKQKTNLRLEDLPEGHRRHQRGEKRLHGLDDVREAHGGRPEAQHREQLPGAVVERNWPQTFSSFGRELRGGAEAGAGGGR